MIYNAQGDNSVDTLRNFSSRVFGKNSYQSSPHYLHWAFSNSYLEVSTSENTSNEVVSMVQKMSVTINRHCLTSFFNYITDKNQSGAGIKHLASIKKEKNFFIPAVSNVELSNVYSKLGANEVGFKWFKRYLLPIPNIPLIYKFNRNKSIVTFDKKNGVRLSNDISHTIITKISELSKIADTNFIGWRLLSLNNNRVFILQSEHDDAMVIVVLGKRHGLPVLRVIGGTGPSPIVKTLVDTACSLGRQLGAVVCLVTIHESQSNNFLSDKKYRPRDGIKTFMKGNIETNSLVMLCGDLGFEEQFGA